jgi:hypothetical protein
MVDASEPQCTLPPTLALCLGLTMTLLQGSDRGRGAIFSRACASAMLLGLELGAWARISTMRANCELVRRQTRSADEMRRLSATNVLLLQLARIETVPVLLRALQTSAAG